MKPGRVGLRSVLLAGATTVFGAALVTVPVSSATAAPASALSGCVTGSRREPYEVIVATALTPRPHFGNAESMRTVLAQLVCEELGLPMEAVTVVNNDTDITPWDVGVHASRTTFIAGNSAIGAARKARGKILAAAAAQAGLNAEELDLRSGHIVEAKSGTVVMTLSKLLRQLHFNDKAELVMTSFYYEPPSKHQDKKFKGDVSAAYAWATQVVEVEVDTDTGIVKLLKVTGAHDVGRVLNRLGIEGQIEGGIVMGQGYALTEELMVENGVVRNPGFRDYKLVTAPEIPEMDIAFIESMDGEGPQGAKGVGEAPAICIAAATANAIRYVGGEPVFVDAEGRPYRRRVDPPESLWVALRQAGLDVPRPPGDLDADLRRAEALPDDTRPTCLVPAKP